MPGEDIYSWSTIAASNANADTSIPWPEGMARAQVNNSSRSEMAAVAKFRNLMNGSIITSGTANAQTFTSGVGYTEVPTGMRVLLKMGLANTGPTTLNMDSISAIAIKDQLEHELVGGEIVANSYREFLYDGTNWRLFRDVGGLVLLDKEEPSTVTPAIIDFTNLTNAYREYTFVGTNLQPSLNNKQLLMRFSVDNGATYLASAYTTVAVVQTVAAGSGPLSGAVLSGLSEFKLTGSMANLPSSARGSFTMKIYGMGATFDPTIMSQAVTYATGNGLMWFAATGIGPPASIGANAVRFFFEDGADFLSGTISVYGLRE